MFSGRLWKHGYEAAKTKEAETKVTMGDQFDEAGLRRSEYATTECRKHGLVSCHPCFLK